MQDYLRVGVVTQTHGVRGEFKVFPTTDDVNRFKKLKKVFVSISSELVKKKVESVKFFKQFVILKLEGVDSMDEAEKLKNVELWVSREDAVACEEDEYYIADLIGLEVFADSGEKVGILKDVFSSSANDVYEVINDEGKSVLLPAIHDCILDVDIKGGKMTVHITEGLM